LQARQNNIKSRINSSKAIGEEDIEIAIAEGLEFNFANKSNSVPLIAPAGIEEKALTVNRLYKKITKRDYNKLAESILRTLGYTQRRTFSL
jgi:6-phosphofructokinase